jgi:hypothetical protein
MGAGHNFSELHVALSEKDLWSNQIFYTRQRRFERIVIATAALFGEFHVPSMGMCFQFAHFLPLSVFLCLLLTLLRASMPVEYQSPMEYPNRRNFADSTAFNCDRSCG